MAIKKHGFKVCSLVTLFHNTLYNKLWRINGRKNGTTVAFPI
jgi:hypothetical protein